MQRELAMNTQGLLDCVKCPCIVRVTASLKSVHININNNTCGRRWSVASRSIPKTV